MVFRGDMLDSRGSRYRRNCTSSLCEERLAKASYAIRKGKLDYVFSIFYAKPKGFWILRNWIETCQTYGTIFPAHFGQTSDFTFFWVWLEMKKIIESEITNFNIAPHWLTSISAQYPTHDPIVLLHISQLMFVQWSNWQQGGARRAPIMLFNVPSATESTSSNSSKITVVINK